MSVVHTFLSYFSRGGYLMWPIFGVSIVAWLLGIEKLFFFVRFRNARKKFLQSVDTVFTSSNLPRSSTGFPHYDAFLEELKRRVEQGRCACTNLFREFLIATVPEIEKGFSSMSAWISVAPLLGLLGTVTGMIQTFRVITDFGLGNPNLTAEGISVALITTQAGLTVAFPMMLFHNYLVNRSGNIIQRLLMDGEEVVRRMQTQQYRTQDSGTGGKQR
jgi:biopolymer transport protein ExbB